MKKCEAGKTFVKADGPELQKTKGVIREAMRGAGSIEAFHGLLEGSGVQAVFRSNDEGSIYGATFIDDNTQRVFNGSTLGKEFSAARFHERFVEHILPDEPEVAPTEEQSGGRELSLPWERDGWSMADAWEEVADAFDFFTPALDQAAHSDDWEEGFKVYRPRRKKRGPKL